MSEKETVVGVRELKDRLSHFLGIVDDGTTLVVCDRGDPVAILSPVPQSGVATSDVGHLAGLAARGLVSLGVPRKRRGRRPRGARVDLSGAVAADRDERA